VKDLFHRTEYSVTTPDLNKSGLKKKMKHDLKNIDQDNVIMKEYHNNSNVSSIKISQTNKILNNHSQSSVIYIGHLPSEFQENEILTFFSQFGDVTNIHLSRSQRTLRSRGYAFIKFSKVDVASIVAQTMNGYLLMGKRKLVSHILTCDKVHPNLFHNKKLHFPHNEIVKSKLYLQRKNTINQVNCSKDPKKMRRIAQRLIRAEKKKRQILAHMDIDYDYPGYFSSSFSVNNSRQTFNSQEITRKNNVHRDNNNNLGIVKTKAATKSTSTGDSSLKRANTELNHVEDKSASKERSEINKSSMRQFVPKNVKEINYVLSSSKKSLKKQKYLTAITDNISEKFYSSMSKHIPSIGKKKKKNGLRSRRA
jgi:nucleolar protein 15